MTTPYNSTLTTLELGDNRIGTDGARALAEALRHNSTLETLNLRGNQIADDGVRAIAEVLPYNSTLTTLKLWNNQIGDNGARAIAEVLRHNSTLTTLELGDNRIGADGARAIAEALRHRATPTNYVLLTVSTYESVNFTFFPEEMITPEYQRTIDVYENGDCRDGGIVPLLSEHPEEGDIASDDLEPECWLDDTDQRVLHSFAELPLGSRIVKCHTFFTNS